MGISYQLLIVSNQCSSLSHITYLLLTCNAPREQLETRLLFCFRVCFKIAASVLLLSQSQEFLNISKVIEDHFFIFCFHFRKSTWVYWPYPGNTFNLRNICENMQCNLFHKQHSDRLNVHLLADIASMHSKLYSFCSGCSGTMQREFIKRRNSFALL